MSANEKPGFGPTIRQADIDKNFLTGPGEDLVAKLLLQLSRAEGVDANGTIIYPFTLLFGPYKKNSKLEKDSDQQRWADYQRQDWTIRMLPAINIFESQTENKTSDQAWLTGTVQIQVFWPPSFRRSDLSRVPAAFKGAIQNFFNSKYAADMLDELYFNDRDSKVYGLNQLGAQINWSPNVEGVLDSEAVPVTILDVSYRIDLRAWNRAMEYMGREKEDPFKDLLSELTSIAGLSPNGYLGVVDPNAEIVEVVVEQNITVSNP